MVFGSKLIGCSAHACGGSASRRVDLGLKIRSEIFASCACGTIARIIVQLSELQHVLISECGAGSVWRCSV